MNLFHFIFFNFLLFFYSHFYFFIIFFFSMSILSSSNSFFHSSFFIPFFHSFLSTHCSFFLSLHSPSPHILPILSTPPKIFPFPLFSSPHFNSYSNSHVSPSSPLSFLPLSLPPPSSPFTFPSSPFHSHSHLSPLPHFPTTQGSTQDLPKSHSNFLNLSPDNSVFIGGVDEAMKRMTDRK